MSLVRCLEDLVTAGIQRLVVLRREDDGVRPLEPDFAGVAVMIGLGPDTDQLDLLGLVVISLQRIAATG